MLYSAHAFINDHTSIYNRYNLLSLYKHKVKTKNHIFVLVLKMGENDILKKVSIQNCSYYCFDDAIKTDEFDFENLLLDEILRKRFNL